ncbi:hypothetical protein [Micromonospora sp. NPDC047187]|uniref:hypothetical protein n=1 Tax=Micromonospora sp. NPDC047187 TaxID=3155262 RepID=UPI0033D76FE2
MTDDNGRVLNAEFAVERDGPGLAVVLESAGGTSSTGPSRNSDYIPALELILARLRTLGAVLVSGVVDSRQTGHLPESERTVLDRPVRLSVVDDLAALRLQLTSRQGRIGQAPNAPKAGNNRKRLRLRIEAPEYGPTDAPRLATEIARPAAAPASSESATELPTQRRSGEPDSLRLNEWWQDDPAECYWLEITDRNDLGANVQALQRDGSGRENWSYALVTALRPGDIVLHWHKTRHQVPAIVGYSRAVDGPFDDELVWQARGTYGQSRPTNPLPQPSWRYELTAYTPLPAPVDQSAFQRAEPALREIKQKLDEAYPAPLYYPFAFYETRPVRVMQAYLVKFPAAILDAVPELAAVPRSRVPQLVRPTPRPRSSPRRKARSSGSGYIADPAVKVARWRDPDQRRAATTLDLLDAARRRPHGNALPLPPSRRWRRGARSARRCTGLRCCGQGGDEGKPVPGWDCAAAGSPNPSTGPTSADPPRHPRTGTPVVRCAAGRRAAAALAVPRPASRAPRPAARGAVTRKREPAAARA